MTTPAAPQPPAPMTTPAAPPPATAPDRDSLGTPQRSPHSPSHKDIRHMMHISHIRRPGKDSTMLVAHWCVNGACRWFRQPPGVSPADVVRGFP